MASFDTPCWATTPRRNTERRRSRAVKLWRGIVIPWFYQGALWRVTIRDEHLTHGNGRYKQVSGGSNGLYLADSLALKRPAVVVTEGEFDALSVAPLRRIGKRQVRLPWTWKPPV